MKRVAIFLLSGVLVFAILAECLSARDGSPEATAKGTVVEANETEKAQSAEKSEEQTEAKSKVAIETKDKTDGEVEAESKVEPESEPEPEPEVYVLIDLSEQHLSVVKAVEVSEKIDGEVLFETGIVSGTANTSRATPTGTYEIYSKVPGKYLKPKGGSKVWVDYWMPFNGGIGLHDATWRGASQFGTDQYKWSGSHGCINLPHDAAATIYDLVEVGTTVLVVE